MVGPMAALHEPRLSDTRLREILTTSPTIAVLGVHRLPEKAAFYVPEYLHDEGYRVIGVNPQFIDQELFRFDAIWAAAGHPNGVFLMTPQQLVALTGAPVIEVAQS